MRTWCLAVSRQRSTAGGGHPQEHPQVGRDRELDTAGAWPKSSRRRQHLTCTAPPPLARIPERSRTSRRFRVRLVLALGSFHDDQGRVCRRDHSDPLEGVVRCSLEFGLRLFGVAQWVESEHQVFVAHDGSVASIISGTILDTSVRREASGMLSGRTTGEESLQHVRSHPMRVGSRITSVRVR
jgi:hypothetical protein